MSPHEGVERAAAPIFRPRTAAMLTWGLLGAVLVTLFFLIFAEPVPDVQPGQPDSYTPSAIGYRALVRLLDGAAPVLTSRSDSASKASPRVPLLLLEPRDSPEALEQLEELVAEALAKEAPVVVVLPKWSGDPGLDPRGWVEKVRPRSPTVPDRVLTATLGWSEESAATILRPETVGAWTSSLAETSGLSAPSLALPQLLPEDDLHFEPLLATEKGLLAAKVQEVPLYLVADPDLLNTSGLSRADNALYAHRLLVDLLDPKSFVVAEEIHGYAVTPSIWRALLRPPLVLVTLHLTALAALVLWAGTGRFGRPLPAPPRVAPGKGTLVENTALLLATGGHYDESVDQYLQWTVRRTAERFSVATGGGLRRQVARLAGLGERRRVSVDLERVARGVVTLAGRGKDPRRALDLARDLYRWRKEMEDARTP